MLLGGGGDVVIGVSGLEGVARVEERVLKDAGRTGAG